MLVRYLFVILMKSLDSVTIFLLRRLLFLSVVNPEAVFSLKAKGSNVEVSLSVKFVTQI